LSANFRWKWTSPANLFWYQKIKVITLSCGIKILDICSFISSQSTRVTDGQRVRGLAITRYINLRLTLTLTLTDRQTDGRIDEQTKLQSPRPR